MPVLGGKERSVYMFRFIWQLIKFGVIIFLIGLVSIVVSAIFEFLAENLLIIILCSIAGIVIYSIIYLLWKRHKKKKAIEAHKTVEEIRLAHLDRQRAEATPDIIENSEYLRYGGINAELLNIDLMEGHDFEYWCASLLRKIGFQNVEVTQASADDGVDILAIKDGIRYAVQCKRYNSDLGNTPIQEVHTGKAVYNCHVGAVMTNRNFTEGGKRAANATGTLLWDRSWMEARLKEISPSYIERIKESSNLQDSLDGDEMLPAAVDIVLETGIASVSLIQRRLNIGYTRASRLVDEMEQKEIIGPFQGSKPRKILITREQYYSQMNHFFD